VSTTSQEVAALQKQNADLQAMLEDAKRKAAAKPAVNTGQSTALTQQNKELTGKLSASQQRVADLEKQVAAKSATAPADSAELKKLRTDLGAAKVDAENAKKAASKSDELAKQNKELAGQLSQQQQHVTELEKQVAAKTATAPANSAELKKLRTDLATAQAQADTAKKASAKAEEAARQNQELSGKLTASQNHVTDLEKQLAGRSAAPADTAQLKKLQAELADARAEVDRTKKANANATALVQQNQALSSQLAASKGQTAELQQARTELAAAQAEAQTAQAASAHAADLEKQNNELAAQLEEAKKGPYIRPTSVAESAEIRDLKTQLDDMHTEVNRAQSANARVDELAKQNADLKAQLEDVRKNAITRVEVVDMNPPGRQIAPAALSQKDAAMMKKLRDENSYMRNLLETYAATNPELKPRLKKYQTDQAKPATPPAPAPSGK
jgi:chromosome segregation ATPase